MIRKIISKSMFFVGGMLIGKIIFSNMELWKSALVCMSTFVILWFIWDGLTDKMEG